jgi:hypothetical protein
MDGVGTLQDEVLARVPSMVEKRKIRRGKSDKTYFHARIEVADGRELLLLEEG